MSDTEDGSRARSRLIETSATSRFWSTVEVSLCAGLWESVRDPVLKRDPSRPGGSPSLTPEFPSVGPVHEEDQGRSKGGSLLAGETNESGPQGLNPTQGLSKAVVCYRDV